MMLLEKHVWKSHIRVDTKVRLYEAYVLPVLVYGSEGWTITKALARRLDAFDTWSLRKILRIPYTRHVTNASVRETTGCPALQFPVSLKQDGSAFLATWHVQIPGNIITELSVHRPTTKKAPTYQYQYQYLNLFSAPDFIVRHNRRYDSAGRC